MKKTILVLLLAVISLGANAQFEKGTHYAEAGLTNFGIGSKNNSFTIGVGAGYGYYVVDGWMLGGRASYLHTGSSDSGQLQALFRYSFKQNGINLGCGLQYEGGRVSSNEAYIDNTDPANPKIINASISARADYVQLCPQVGYTFYLNHYVSVEPALYADICMNDIKNGTNFGLKVAFGLYYNKKK